MSNDARIGDVTDHGGVIVTGAGKMVVEGAPTARIGDMTACGATIVSGAARLIIGT